MEQCSPDPPTTARPRQSRIYFYVCTFAYDCSVVVAYVVFNMRPLWENEQMERSKKSQANYTHRIRRSSHIVRAVWW